MTITIRRPRPIEVGFVAALAALLIAATALGATLQKNGKAVTAVRTATADVAVFTQSSTFTDVPGMSVTVGVPSGQKGLLVITFSSIALCIEPANFCHVRVLLDGKVVPPGQVSFDSTEDGQAGSSNKTEANSMQWVASGVGPGSHTVKVQYSVLVNGGTFYLGQKTLTVLRSRM